MLEKETGVPVIGYLPPMPEAAIESRHLGLKTAGEIENLQKKITLLHETMEKTVDFEKLYSVFACPAPKVPKEEFPIPNVRIAVARDEAFCFTYTETLEAFKEAGAEPVFSAHCTIKLASKYRRAVSARRLPGALRKGTQRKYRDAFVHQNRNQKQFADCGRMRRLFVFRSNT